MGNQQGTGTTIVQIPPGGSTASAASVFAQIDPNALPGRCPGGVGLTTALAVTRTGYVVVGSLPTSDGTAATAKAGCLIVLNSHGQVVETIAGGPINGPWDMTAVEQGSFTTLYVTNVLNGTVKATTDFTMTGRGRPWHGRTHRTADAPGRPADRAPRGRDRDGIRGRDRPGRARHRAYWRRSRA